MPDNVLMAEARFSRVTTDGRTTHIAQVRFPDGHIAVGVGDTPEQAMENAFMTLPGAQRFSYGPAYEWTKPPWLTETGDDTTDERDVEAGLDHQHAPRSH